MDATGKRGAGGRVDLGDDVRRVRRGRALMGVGVVMCGALGALAFAGPGHVARAPSAAAQVASSMLPAAAARPAAARGVSAPGESFGGLPVAFEENVGQAGDEVRFVARGGASSVLLARNEAVFLLGGRGERRGLREPAPATASALHMRLAHALPTADVVGEELLAGRANYLIGNDPSAWKRGVSRFGQVRMRGVYEGIDVVYHGGEHGALEYDFVVKKGADPRRIELAFDDARGVTRGEGGELQVAVGAETVIMKPPVSYQIAHGERKPVEVAYRVHGKSATLQVGAYDPDLELVVDPIINFSTYLGGAGQERVTCLARDPAGNLYLSGETSSVNFPTKGSPPGGGAALGDVDAFVTKLNPTGSAVLYSTYIGGTSTEYLTDNFAGFITGPRNCAVDAQGRLHVSTTTFSADFPTTVGAFDRTLGALDVTLSRLNPAGDAFEFSTYLGGSNSDYWASIAIDSTGHTWVTGHTHSSDFPTANPVQATKPNPDPDDQDGFVVRVRPDGSGVTFASYFGGSQFDYPFDVAVNAVNDAYIVGVTGSPNFPVTPGAFQTGYSGGSGLGLGDAFLVRFKLAGGGGATLDYSTFIGGSADEVGQALALGADGSVYLGGVTNSNDFPGQVGRPGSATTAMDGFVLKLDPTAKTRVYSRLFGQEQLDSVYDIAVNAAGNAFVAGTGTLGATTVNGCGRPGDRGILGMLKVDGSGWEYLTPFGQVNTQIVIDSADTVFVAGWGQANAIPVVGAVAQPTFGGGTTDGYLLKMAKLPNATSTGCAGCTGDFGAGGARDCPTATPKCLSTGECVTLGQCQADPECGGVTSGRVCDARVCRDGCRGQGGNGCPSGSTCTSTTAAIGQCVAVPVDAGPDAPPPVDAAPGPTPVPAPTPTTPLAPVPAPVPADPNDQGSLEGGGLSCAVGAAGNAAPGVAAFGLLALLGLVARRRASRDDAAG